MDTTRGNQKAVLDEYRTWLLSWASPRTVAARVTLATARLSDWGLDGFTAHNVTEFLASPSPLTGKQLSTWSKATYHGHLKDFCTFLVATGRMGESPMEQVRSVKRPKRKPHPLSQSEVDRVLSVVRGQTRDQILLALLAGLRVSEIARIRGEDVTPDGIYVEGKGDVADMVGIHPDIWAMAQRYPRTGFWFPGSDEGHVPSGRISQNVGRLFHSMGIKGSIHRGRHYYATTLLRNGVHVRRVQELMRHANLETTAGYAAVDQDELQSAVNLLPSLDAPTMPETA